MDVHLLHAIGCTLAVSSSAVQHFPLNISPSGFIGNTAVVDDCMNLGKGDDSQPTEMSAAISIDNVGDDSNGGEGDRGSSLQPELEGGVDGMAEADTEKEGQVADGTQEHWLRVVATTSELLDFLSTRDVATDKSMTNLSLHCSVAEFLCNFEIAAHSVDWIEIHNFAPSSVQVCDRLRVALREYSVLVSDDKGAYQFISQVVESCAVWTSGRHTEGLSDVLEVRVGGSHRLFNSNRYRYRFLR